MTKPTARPKRRPKAPSASPAQQRSKKPGASGSATCARRSKAAPASEPIRAVQVDKRGMGVGGRIHWESTVSATEITSAQAEDAQTRAGYSPLGYGFFGFSCRKVDGGYQATWTCSTSCD